MSGEVTPSQWFTLIRIAKNAYELREVGKRLAKIDYLSDDDKTVARQLWVARRAEIVEMKLESDFHCKLRG